jgi:hypothetical protein
VRRPRRVGWPRLICGRIPNTAAFAQVRAKREDLTRRSSSLKERDASLRTTAPWPSSWTGPEMSALQNIPMATLQHALTVLADDGLVLIHQRRTAIMTGSDRRSGRAPAARTMTAGARDSRRTSEKAADGEDDVEHPVWRLRHSESPPDQLAARRGYRCSG